MNSSILAALEDLRSGRPVIVVDDADRENEGDLILAAELTTPETMAFVVRHTSGVVCVAMERERLDALQLPPMVSASEDPRGTAFTVSVDAAAGITSGISARDRALTARVLAAPETAASALRRPGHVFPLAAQVGGVLRRRGHTEAAVDLTRLAGLAPAGLLAEIVDDDGSMARGARLERFAARHHLRIVSIEQLVEHRVRVERLVDHVSRARLPAGGAMFQAHGFRSRIDGQEHLALTLGDLDDVEPALVRVHSECLTGDVAGSARCDCGEQWRRAMRLVVEEGRGVLIYLRGHEGRGIGLAAKLSAYALQDEQSLDTLEANVRLGLPVDARCYLAAVQILRELGVSRVRLLSNNHDKIRALRAGGIEVCERLPLIVTPGVDNLSYLRAKQDRLGHSLGLPATGADVVDGHHAV
jgi:3,4-dihydroxy 2-butanone 4-phosphate synthase/GTP cyclohydrolase II